MFNRRELLGGAVLLLPLLRRAARADVACHGVDPNELGPYYRAGAPERASLADPGEAGDRFGFVGGVADETCHPVPSALIEVWHADAKGVYDMVAPGRPRDEKVFHLRAVLRSRADGSFRFDTIVPGPYGDRSRHVHLAVHADGFEPFITQIYFPDDPLTRKDRIFRPRNQLADLRKARMTFGLRRRRAYPAEVIAHLSDYEGDFRTPDGTVSHHARIGDALFADVPGYGRLELLFDAPDRFRVLEFDMTGHPERDASGRVKALLVQSFGDERPTRIERVA